MASIEATEDHLRGYVPNAGPDFIGVGVPKAGTTWLDSLLRCHPDVWLPPVKELHFFDDYYRGREERGLARYVSTNPWVRSRWRRTLVAVGKNALRHPTRSRLGWAWRYLFQPLGFEWYKSLFPNFGLRRGEITPDYCILSRAQVGEVHRHFPNARILFMLRNPVERAWSHCRMELIARVGRETSDLQEPEIRRFLFRDNGVSLRSHASAALASWLDAYGRASVFVGVFDDLRDDPVCLAKDVLSFLDLEAGVDGVLNQAQRQVFRGIEVSIPPAIEAELIEYFKDELKELDLLLPDRQLSARWMPSD